MDEQFMTLALEQAALCSAAGDVPVGCVIVCDGRIIAASHNTREQTNSALGHAELNAIGMACHVLGRWRLTDCTLYVTLEPCPMCAGAIINARIGTVVFGAYDKKGGAVGGVLNLFEEGFSHRPKVYGGVLKTECEELLQEFFGRLR